MNTWIKEWGVNAAILVTLGFALYALVWWWTALPVVYYCGSEPVACADADGQSGARTERCRDIIGGKHAAEYADNCEEE